MRKADLKPTLKIEPQRDEGDCCISCIAALTGTPYADVIVAAAEHRRSRRAKCRTMPHRTGMYFSEIAGVCKKLGFPLRNKTPDFIKDKGILRVRLGKDVDAHAVVLMCGLIFDFDDSTVWIPQIYKDAKKAKIGQILVPI